MGFFFKALGAMVAADAIDRSARRPTRYWYPAQPGLPRPGSEQPYAVMPVAPPGWYPDPGGLRLRRWWDGGRWTHHTTAV